MLYFQVERKQMKTIYIEKGFCHYDHGFYSENCNEAAKGFIQFE